MFRIEERPGARLRELALPVALALLVSALGGTTTALLSRLTEERALVGAASDGRAPAGEAIRAVGSISGSDRALAVASLALSIAVAVVTAVLGRAYARAQRRLRELKVFSADVLESVALGIVTLDLAGRVTAINGKAGVLLGIDPGRTRVPYAEAFEGAPILCDAAERLLHDRAPFRNLEVAASGIGLARPGSGGGADATRTLSVDGSFLETDRGARIGAVIQVTDVTEQKRVEREVRRSEQLATLGTLAASVAHEIRNPLAALDINLQLLTEALESAGGTGYLANRGGRYLGVIESEVRRLDGIVENFIRFARTSPLERAPVDVGGLALATLALVLPECRKGRVTVAQSGLEGARAVVLGVEGELKQALLNVILNALQAMPDGGDLAVSLERGPSQARLSVRDTGPGIPPRARDRVFDLFFTTREGGTGLGLPIARKIVGAHGGDIAFETGGGGTTFTITLPLARAAPVPADAVA